MNEIVIKFQKILSTKERMALNLTPTLPQITIRWINHFNYIHFNGDLRKINSLETKNLGRKKQLRNEGFRETVLSASYYLNYAFKF